MSLWCWKWAPWRPPTPPITRKNKMRLIGWMRMRMIVVRDKNCPYSLPSPRSSSFVMHLLLMQCPSPSSVFFIDMLLVQCGGGGGTSLMTYPPPPPDPYLLYLSHFNILFSSHDTIFFILPSPFHDFALTMILPSRFSVFTFTVQ